MVVLPQLYRMAVNKLLGALTSSFLVFADKIDAVSNVTFFIDNVSSEF
ncbi:hypothetical protein GA0061098_105711 [Bradyrhizobium shewense]|uniref:Uncharacterized protein n=1 Tax=Bradyrhizobium shewense TaxID=1761772 RepID=A0A1C3XUD5_9BRAD|nr:hypothetical protein GA0061098_105711 [Bradyrhizobium shewense]